MNSRQPEVRQEAPSAYLALIVIDATCKVQFSFWDGAKGNEAKQLLCDESTRLRPEIETRIAALIGQFGPNREAEARIVLFDEDRALRVSPLHGSDASLFALIVEADRNYDSIARASSRFQLTKRQTEVLALVLEGMSAGEIADTLSISEYTAQGYIKSLLSKTSSRNRAAMVAKVLDWNQTRVAARTAAAERELATVSAAR